MPKLPNNERERLQALERYRILDTEAEESFDQITRIAAAYFNTPIALVSLVDDTRQWFKSKIGLDVAETPRDIAFCAHAICDDKTMIVEDAQLDRRFINSPLVKGAPNIRFYAGAPLRTHEGENLGTLCVIDTLPRQFSELDTKVLQDLSGIVIDQLELRLSNLQKEEELARHIENMTLLRDNQTRFNAIFNSTYDAILLLDQGGRITSHNTAAAQIFGYNTSELIGLHAKALMPDSFSEKVETYQKSHHKSGTYRKFLDDTQENNAVRKNGERFASEFSVSEIVLNNERHFCLIGRDISKKKHAEHQLNMALSMAEKSQAAQLELLSTLSHELLTPLNAIIGFSDILLMDLKKTLTSEQAKHFQHIVMAGKRLATITRKSLVYSKETSKLKDLKIEEIPLIPLIEKCWRPLEYLADKKGIEFSLNFDTSEILFIQADPDSICKVFAKVFSNAIAFNKPNGQVEVNISHDDALQTLIAIKNTGAGINNADAMNIFEFSSYIKDDNAEENEIDLALCSAIMASMNGEIRVSSESESGCIFYLQLPSRVKKQIDSLMPLPSHRMHAPESTKPAIKKILYILENAEQMNEIQKILEARTDLVSTCSTRGPLALAIAIQSTPDLIVLNTEIENRYAYTLLEKLKSNNKTCAIPILLIRPEKNTEHANQQNEGTDQAYVTISNLRRSLEAKIDSLL